MAEKVDKNNKKSKTKSSGKQKIAIMGDSGVGKSVFLTSYFKYSTEDGEGSLSIHLSDSRSIEYINQNIKTLFIDSKPIYGTDKRYELSFNVINYDLTIELHDIPGGWTITPDNWEDSAIEIAQDLRNADGVLFFVSAEDLLTTSGQHNENRYYVLQTFSKALHLVREPENKKIPRKDVPICVVITKCDLFPDISQEQLEEKLKGFIRNASTKKSNNKWFGFTKGKYVKCWQSIAMGKWDNNNPPTVHEHKNVLEPIEWLIKTMLKSHSEHRKGFKKLIYTILSISFIGALCFVIGIDHYKWYKVKNTNSELVQANQYQQAENLLRNFNNRIFFKSMLPSFLSAGNNINSLINKVQEEGRAFRREMFESNAIADFKSISSYIESVDFSQYPDVSTRYIQDAVEQIEMYLNRTEYYSVTPDRYEAVRQALSYWKNSFELRQIEDELEAIEPAGQEALLYLEKLLQVASNIPQEWQSHLAPIIYGLTNEWYRGLPKPDTPQALQELITQAYNISQYEMIPQESRLQIESWITRWEDAAQSMWRDDVQNWLRKSERMDPEEAILFLEGKKTEEYLPDNYIADLDQRIAYNMAEKIKIHTNALNERIGRTRNLEEMASDGLPLLETFKRDHPSHSSKAIHLVEQKFKELLKYEKQEIKSQFNNYVRSNDIRGARHLIKNRLDKLNQDIRKFQGQINLPDKNKIDRLKNELIDELRDVELIKLKRRFRMLLSEKSPSQKQINDFINITELFLEMHSSSAAGKEVRQVKSFLKQVNSGIKLELKIIKSQCEISFIKGSKMRLSVYSSAPRKEDLLIKKLKGEEIYWNESLIINWNPRRKIAIKLERIKLFWGEPVVFIDLPYNSNHICGFKNFNHTFRDKSCNLKTRVSESSLPALPEGWD